MNADLEATDAGRQLTRAWWLFLVTGIGWVLVAMIVLTVDPGTTVAIGYLTGFVLLAAGINQLVTIAYVDSLKWLYGILGALFLIGGILALMEPFQTFGILALLIGWYLLVKGTFDVVMSVAERHVLHLWGLVLASGLIEIAIGIWAIGSPGRSAWLLVLWVGLTALMRGITEIVLAFKLRSGPPETLAVA
ncbi:MAG: DUF308 domain-containing protein [Actinobacteria bacterium]|nr:DUF308 domain-containing protein [Actinomycetota bacterium]